MTDKLFLFIFGILIGMGLGMCVFVFLLLTMDGLMNWLMYVNPFKRFKDKY